MVFVTGISVAGFAQKPYQKAIGLRISPNSYYDLVAVSYKFFISDAGAIELNGGIGVRGYAYGVYGSPGYDKNVKPFAMSVSGAYQHHFEIPVRGGGLAWFIGGGLTGYNVFSDNGNFNGFGLGLFPTGGVDYKIPKIPLAVSVDYRPTILVASPKYYDSFYGTNVGLSARYTFGE